MEGSILERMSLLDWPPKGRTSRCISQEIEDISTLLSLRHFPLSRHDSSLLVPFRRVTSSPVVFFLASFSSLSIPTIGANKLHAVASGSSEYPYLECVNDYLPPYTELSSAVPLTLKNPTFLTVGSRCDYLDSFFL